MKMKVQLIIEDKSGSTATTEIATLERGESDELIGLSLEEAKAMTASAQRALVEVQAREAIDRGTICTRCKDESKLSHEAMRTRRGRWSSAQLAWALRTQLRAA